MGRSKRKLSVHKGGADNDPTNYRPIAVVSIIAKILEKIVATQLSVYSSLRALKCYILTRVHIYV